MNIFDEIKARLPAFSTAVLRRPKMFEVVFSVKFAQMSFMLLCSLYIYSLISMLTMHWLLVQGTLFLSLLIIVKCAGFHSSCSLAFFACSQNRIFQPSVHGSRWTVCELRIDRRCDLRSRRLSFVPRTRVKVMAAIY